MSGGLVAVIANDAARFSEFTACVMRLDIPDGWDKEMVIGGDWCGARNSLAQHVLDNDYTHLWFMDDDHSFAPDLLNRLLAWNKPLVNPVCLTRTFPFQPVVYTHRDPSLGLQYLPVDFDGKDAEGLVEIEAGGTAGMLIRRDVLEAIQPPWFEYTNQSEDIVFCQKAKDAGFQLYADLGARLGHITTAVVWPWHDNENGWLTGFTIGKDYRVLVPTAQQFIDQANAEAQAEEQPAETPAENESGVVKPVDDPGFMCMVCGQPGAWQDIHGQIGCGDHQETNEVWRTFWERAEIWLNPIDNRWYGRVLRGDGTIGLVLDRSHTQESGLVDEIQRKFPGLSINLIHDELDDSRRQRIGPPLRLWDRTVT